MSLPGIRSFSRLPLRNIDGASSSSTPFSALADINYVSSPSSDLPKREANTNVRDTPPRANPDVQAWVNKLCISPNAGGEGNIAAPESQFRDNASCLNALPTSPLGEIAIDEDDIIIAVMGPTGVGKSTFVDRAFGRPDVGAGHDLKSYTKEMRPLRYPHSDGIRNIVLVDTPGFDDTFMTDAQILRQIAHWLNTTYKKNIKLSGILYLHRISDNRVSGTPLRNYNMFKELCGKDNFKNVILVTTMWDEVAEEVGSAREKELRSDFWRSMISLGSSVYRFEGTMESAWKIINSLSVAPPSQRRPLQIQREMVDEHVPLHRTAAGRAVMATFTGLMSGVKGIFKRLGNRTKRSYSLLSAPAVRHLSLGTQSAGWRIHQSVGPGIHQSVGPGIPQSVETEIITPSSSGICSTEGYWSGLIRVVPALQAALGMAELVRIPYLKDVIAPSLGIALSIETMAGAHHALFQVLETATLLVNVVAERARQTRLSADVKAAIKDFAKQMGDVQGIVQNIAQRESEERRVLQSTDARIISACVNSMRLVCDVLRSAPSLRTNLRGVDDSLGALKRSLEIDSCNCGISGGLVQPISPVGVRTITPSRFTENDYIIFVVGPTEADQSWFAKQLFENHDLSAIKIGEHVKALRCNLINNPTNIVVVSIPSFKTDDEDSGAENTAIHRLKLSCFEKCHSGILFLHPLDLDQTDARNVPITRHLEAFARALPDKFPVPSGVYVVPTTNSDPSELLNQRLSHLKTMLNDKRNSQWHATLFPGIFEGQPEIAWSATLLLLRDISESQANGTIPVPIEPALKRMPPQFPNRRLSLQDLADLLLKEFRKKRSGDLGPLVTLARTALEFTPPEHPYHHSVLINLANLLFEQFKKKSTKVDLDEVITLRRTAWECIPQDDAEKQTILLELDDCLCERFKREDTMEDLEEIISLRRLALERTPPPNRCRQLLNLANSVHEKFVKQGLVNDIEEAVSLADTALGLCLPGHSDHPLSRDHLASYLKAKVRARGTRHTSDTSGPVSSDIKQLVKKIFFEKVEKFPLRLLHTRTGILCNRDAQLSHFEHSLQYKQLLLSTSPRGSQELETEISDAVLEFFGFAMLSHRWERGEPLLRDVEGKRIYDLAGTDGLAKLQDFCILALECNFQWAWSDTCCIDKDSSAELQEAIGSMFSWYRQSSLTIVYLSDVSNNDSLAHSAWFKRGWTLQELLAPHTVLFYARDWSLYTNRGAANHKADPAFREELHKATGIADQHLTNFHPGMDDARSRLHWASGRRTTRPEDIAYSLFGIFQVHLPVLYGETEQNAIGRLLAEIISRSGDVSVLDWVGEPSSFNSCFPADLVPYQTVSQTHLIPSDSARRSGLDVDKTQKLYNKLAGLPRAGFVNSKLILPSTIHPVTAVRLKESSTSPSRYTYEIHASRLRPVDVTLSVKLSRGAGTYMLVRPWHPKSLDTTESDDNAVWSFLEQLEQPFNALLLKRLHHNEYKRIASNCMITVCVQDLASTLDSEVLILDIV